jgi:hypothetical protein
MQRPRPDEAQSTRLDRVFFALADSTRRSLLDRLAPGRARDPLLPEPAPLRAAQSLWIEKYTALRARIDCA